MSAFGLPPISELPCSSQPNPLINPDANRLYLFASAWDASYASPANFFSPSVPERPASAMSTRSKRSGRSTSSSSSGGWDAFVEEDLRAGGPRLPELPCETFPGFPRDHPYYTAVTGMVEHDLSSGIRSIGRNYHLQIIDINYCQRRSIFRPEQTSQLTVLVYARRGNVAQRGWADIARKMLAFLNGKGFPLFRVEIMDPRLEESHNLFSCLPTDSIYHLWETVVKQMLSQLDLSGIQNISCHRRGYSENIEECPVTILIVVDHRSMRNWDGVRETVLQVLDGLQLSEVGVLIRKDFSIFQMETQQASSTTESAACPHEVNRGDSVSLHRSKGSQGTFGSWFELLDPNTGQWVPYGITCSHVMFPEDDLTPEEVNTMQAWKYTGFGFGNYPASQFLRVDSPSRKQMIGKIEHLNRVIINIETREDFQNVGRAIARGDFVIPREVSEWRVNDKVRRAWMEQRRAVQEPLDQRKNALGYVAAVSGLREKRLDTVSGLDQTTTLSSIVDWALLQPENRIVGLNRPRDEPKIKEFTGLRSSKLGREEMLWSYGIATGLTEFCYNILRSCSITHRMVNGQDTVIETMEHQILREVGGLRDIVKPGDSGALVYDVQDQVVGMILGGLHDGTTGYFTHIADLVDEIKHVTGALDVRVRRP